MLRLESRFVGGRYLTRHIGNLWRDREALRANSPQRLAERFKIPVLLVHGEKDRVVDVAQSRAMYRALQRADKTASYVELPEGDHSLSRQDNRIRFSSRLIEFLPRVPLTRAPA